MSKLNKTPNSYLNCDRNGIAQVFGGIGVYEPIQFTAIRNDTLNEYVVGAGNWYFQPIHAGTYLIHARYLPNGGAALEHISYIAIADTLGIFYKTNNQRTYRAALPVPIPDCVEITAIINLVPTVRYQILAALDVAGSIEGSIQYTYFMAYRLT